MEVMPLVYVIHHHTRVEGDGGQNGDLGRSVEAVHVSGGISLGEAGGLGLAQGLVVVHGVVGHAGEHVVGRAVHDAHDRRDLVGDERVLERVDDGDAAAHARLEGDLLAGGSRGVHDLLAVGGHERLVGGDHVLASGQGPQHHGARDGGAADELHHQVDVGVIDDLVEIVGEQVAHAMRLGLCRAERAHARQLHVNAVVALEVVLVVLQDVDAATAHGACPD